MAIIIAPTGYFPGITFSSSGVYIPYTDLQGYDIADMSGDIRTLAYAFHESLSDSISTIPASGRPVQMTLQKSQSLSGDNVITRSYMMSFKLDMVDNSSSLSVVSES